MPRVEPSPAPPDLRFYAEAAREAVSAIRDRECTFVSGSLIEGLGNAASDLDVYVITDSRETPPAAMTFRWGSSTVMIDYVGDLRTDVELWPRATVLACAAAIGACAPGDIAAAAGIEDRELQLAHRLRVGVAVEGAEILAELQAKFDWAHLSRVICNRFLADYNGWAEDASGAVRDGDPGTAMLASRLALGCAVDAHLAASGDTNSKAKWRFKKLQALGDDDLARNYLELEADTSTEPAALLAQARSRLRYAVGLTSKAASA